MKRMLLLAVAISLMAVCSHAARADLTADQRATDAESIISLFEHRYAPAPWKKMLRGIEFGGLADEFRERAAAAANDEEFFEAAARFTAGLQDAHVNVFVPSTLTSFLGFEVDSVQGHVVIAYVDRGLLPREVFPFDRGDEIVAIDGETVDDIRDDLAHIRATGSLASDARDLAYYLTWRPQALFPAPPEGVAEVTIKPRSLAGEIRVQTPWLTEGMRLAPTLAKGFNTPGKLVEAAAPLSPLDRLRVISLKRFRRLPQVSQDGGTSSGAPFFPLWESFKHIAQAPVFAGALDIGDKHIAFMRFDTFDFSSKREAAIRKFLGSQVSQWEDSTDAMIIDLTGNTGGDLCFGEAIASFLTSTRIKAALAQIKPTRIWSNEFEWQLMYTSDEREAALAESIVALVREGLSTGDDLSDPIALCASDGEIVSAVELGLASKGYSKPILILVDEFTVSMGEIFPAILNDAGRAKVFGATTMGAGGNVVEVGPIGVSDVTVAITESLIVRPRAVALPNGMRTRYIENVGVAPDFPYEITMDDFVGGYERYRSAIERALSAMLQ